MSIKISNEVKILIAVNKKLYSQKAVEFTAQLFKNIDCHITLFYVRATPRSSVQFLNGLRQKLKNKKINVSTKTRIGDLKKEFFNECIGPEYDLVVFGISPTSSLLKGFEISLPKICEQILESTNLSVLIVRNPSDNIKKTLIYADGSRESEMALRFWGKLVQGIEKDNHIKTILINVVSSIYGRFSDYIGPLERSQLEVLEAVPSQKTQSLYAAKDILKKYTSNIFLKLVEGSPEKIISREAEKEGVDLIILKGKEMFLDETILSILRRLRVSTLIVQSELNK